VRVKRYSIRRGSINEKMASVWKFFRLTSLLRPYQNHTSAAPFAGSPSTKKNINKETHHQINISIKKHLNKETHQQRNSTKKQKLLASLWVEHQDLEAAVGSTEAALEAEPDGGMRE